jgi:calcium channel MID1
MSQNSRIMLTTPPDASCQVLFDLTFCDSVAYAVPSSPDFSGDDARLKKLYDEQAEKYYKNFTRSLAQVACDTESTAQYSLARTCKHCETDYKNWLCSVLIPRCEDWNAKGEWLQERNINALLPDGTMTYNGNISDAFKEEKRDRFAYKNSRNPMIDKDIRPGPYKEMKPCEDLCFDIVRSCPAQLGFSCPNSPAREMGYGKRDPKQEELRCNFPGAVVKLNVKGAAGKLTPRLVFAVVVTVLVAGFQLL